MKLTLLRNEKNDRSCFGIIYLDKDILCHTLENSQFLIPTGSYELRISYSPKFSRELPELVNVPKRYGIRIHAGNYHTDSQGCILVGEKSENMLLNSRKTLEKIITTIKEQKINQIEVKEL